MMTRIQVLSRIGLVSALMQMAEECNELSHALLKEARILDGTNPTPVTLEQAQNMVTEEFSDLMLCADMLRLSADPAIMAEKWNRFIGRLNEAGERCDD